MPALKPRRALRLKRHDGLTPAEAAIEFRVAKARAPKQDETDAIELAREFGADIDDVLELVCERRAIRMYEGNYSPARADELGLEDARCILVRRLADRHR